MTAMDLDRLVERALAARIAEEVAGRITARWRSALVLFTASDLALEPALKNLDRLASDGWTFSVVMSKGARGMFARTNIHDYGISAPLIEAIEGAKTGRRRVDPLLDEASILLVPTLSLTLAAKLALGLQDAFASRLLARALERGRTIIVAADGCCPSSRARAERGDRLNDGYRAMMAGHLETLRSFGITIAWAGTLARAATSARPLGAAFAAALGQAMPTTLPAPREDGAASPRPAARQDAVAPATVRGGPRRVFGRSDAVLCGDKTITLGADVLVTPLAADELRARGVRVVRA